MSDCSRSNCQLHHRFIYLLIALLLVIDLATLFLATNFQHRFYGSKRRYFEFEKRKKHDVVPSDPERSPRRIRKAESECSVKYFPRSSSSPDIDDLLILSEEWCVEEAALRKYCSSTEDFCLKTKLRSPALQGQKGQKGESGIKGEKGDLGSDGAPGIKGTKGERGIAGINGKDGIPGIKGNIGPEGMRGDSGEKGDKGDVGPEGMKGEVGAEGTPGVKGDIGRKGIRGISGEKGDKGDVGLEGIKGEVGAVGIPGVKGDIGQKGIRGDSGEKGEKGNQGPKGIRGKTGIPGLSGIQGLPGFIGQKGEKGNQGLEGIRGETGTAGIPGQKGEKGIPGDKGQKGELDQIKFRISDDRDVKDSHDGKVTNIGKENWKTKDLGKRKNNCSLYQVGNPRFHHSSDSEWGWWMKDPMDDTRSERIWLTKNEMEETKHLYEFRNEEDLRNGNIAKNYSLPYSFVGNGHIMHGGSLYYQAKNSDRMVKFDTSTNTWKTFFIRDAAFDNGKHLYSTNHNFVDFEADENGLWVVYASRHSENIAVIKFDPDTLEVLYKWNLTLDRQTIGEAFVACGSLYVVDDVTEPDTTVRLVFDLYENTTKDVEVDFVNSCERNYLIKYNWKERRFYSWDGGNLITYPLTFTNNPD